MNITDIIISTKGRDTGKFSIVISATEDGYMYLVDGKARGITNPKRKKQKHGQKVGTCHEKLATKLLSGDKITNNDIRRALSEFSEDTDQKP